MPGMETPTFWRHRKTGADYKRVGTATVRCRFLVDEGWAWLCLDADQLFVVREHIEAKAFGAPWPVMVQTTAPLDYGDEVAFYQPLLAGKIPAFVRRLSEFEDGRFSPLEMCQHSRSAATDRCRCPHCAPWSNPPQILKQLSAGAREAFGRLSQQLVRANAEAAQPQLPRLHDD